MFVKTIEELLHMMGNVAAQAVAHVSPNIGGKIEGVALGQRREAVRGGLLVPRLEIERGEDVRVSAEARLPEDRLEAHASREDHGDAASMVLGAPPKPRQERVGRLPAFRRDAVVLPLEEPVDENRQLVEREHHRQIVLGERLEDLVALLLPVSRVDSRAQLDLQFRDGQRVDSIDDPAQSVGESGSDPVPRAPDGRRPGRDLGDRVLGGIGSLQVDEDRRELPLVIQAAEQLSDQARLAHPPLRCEQRMRSVLDTLPERLELDLAVVEPVSLDPVCSGLLQLHEFRFQQVDCNNIIGNESVGYTGMPSSLCPDCSLASPAVRPAHARPRASRRGDAGAPEGARDLRTQDLPRARGRARRRRLRRSGIRDRQDWVAEETDHPREVIEAALAHVVRNKVEAAYRRTDLFERRRRLMDDWAEYLAGRRAGTET